MKDKCEEFLKKLTSKKHIIFTSRCNSAILASLKLVQEKGFSDIFIPDMGGWMTYPQYIKKLKLTENIIMTDFGSISEFNESNSVLLFNSMPGYFIDQDSESLYSSCKQNSSIMINDICGSVGSKDAMFGDILVCSFGRWKPIDLGEGGFIATDNDEFLEFFKKFEFLDLDFKTLFSKLTNLNNRLSFLKKIVNKVKIDLKDFDIIHPDKFGLNVIVRFSSESEKEKLIKYCEQENLEWVECPKYIRVLDDAISIEIKRLVS